MKSDHIFICSVDIPIDIKQLWVTSHIAKTISWIHHTDYGYSNEETTVTFPHLEESSLSLKTYQTLISNEVPSWLLSIDRISRWDNPTNYDRALREYLHDLALMPYRNETGLQTEAINALDKFVTEMDTTDGHIQIMSQATRTLNHKDSHLLQILSKGVFHTINHTHLTHWRLPREWFGLRIFVLDNTNQAIDSTEAYHVVIQKHPSIDVFINFRKKNNSYHYSARSQHFPLTFPGSFFNGHPSSAGAVLHNPYIIPFY